MTPDEIICTTCKGEGAVLTIGGWKVGPLDDWTQQWVREWRRAGDASGEYDWQVDACPECGRSRGVGRL